MLNSETFKSQVSEEWWPKLKPWFESEDAFNVYAHLKKRSSERHKIFPESNNTFRAFKYNSPKNIKAVIVGLSPYHTLGTNKMANADGLAFSCSLTREEQPSLKLFIDAMQRDVGVKFTRPTDLSYISEQGVLLLNYSLTSEYLKATIHSDMNLWGGFNEFLFTEIFASLCGTPFLLCGKQAQTLEKYLFPMCHVIKKVEHPAAAARDQRKWNHDGAFNWINKILTDNNGEYASIQWDYDEWGSIPF